MSPVEQNIDFLKSYLVTAVFYGFKIELHIPVALIGSFISFILRIKSNAYLWPSLAPGRWSAEAPCLPPACQIEISFPC